MTRWSIRYPGVSGSVRYTALCVDDEWSTRPALALRTTAAIEISDGYDRLDFDDASSLVGRSIKQY